MRKEDICFEDGAKSGRPQSIKTNEKIDMMKELVPYDPFIDHHSSNFFGIRYQHRIGSHDPQRRFVRLRSLCGKPMPHSLTQMQKTHRMDCPENILETLENESPVARRLVIKRRSDRKVMRKKEY